MVKGCDEHKKIKIEFITKHFNVIYVKKKVYQKQLSRFLKLFYGFYQISKIFFTKTRRKIQLKLHLLLNTVT